MKEWGSRVGVAVTVEHIDNGQMAARTAAEIQANQGHDLILHIAPVPQFEPSVLDLTDVVTEAVNRHGPQLELCRKGSFNPTTKKFFAFAPAFVPAPGDFRRSLWEPAGPAAGPSTYEDLLRGATEINAAKGIRCGLGLSQEIDSNSSCRALLWGFGASVQDAREQVVINSPQTIAAVEFMVRLFKQSMTPEVFGWTSASNNQGLISGQLSYIQNAISAWRTLQDTDPQVADDVFFTPALRGPVAGLNGPGAMYNWIVPAYARNPNAAKEFLLHYVNNLHLVTWYSKLYDSPAFPRVVPKLGEWLRRDPFGAKPADKLSLLGKVSEWSTNVGHPGPANTAEGEVFATFIIPTMFARAARGEVKPQQAVADAEAQIKPIFDKWRQRGLIGTGGG